MKKVIITGASGFIGKALTVKLINQGVFVYAIVRNEKKMEDLSSQNLKVIRADIKDYKNLSDKICDNIDTFYHLEWVGVSGPNYNDYKEQIDNIKASCDAVSTAMILKCKRFVFVGSSHQYLSVKKNGITVPANTSVYGCAKMSTQLICKTLVKNSSMFFNTALFTNVFGVGDFSLRSTNLLITKFLNNENPRLISGEHQHDWIYIDDAVAGLIAITERGIPDKDYYIGNLKLKTFKQIISNVRDIVNPQIQLVFGEYEDPTFIDYTKIDLEELYRDTGFEVKCNFEESISKTAEWVKTLNI
ncbi:nucleoside-diphosphate-sugar epimerase [Hydrogenoanaerobacterium saccharovorans]|uniref:Nucleoside-diphosphate-sugar epimerase n=1 Tax=Hydrogenoanaerobacterium saccharovorans TaxID=474960 RepID=A0A1H8EG67_9FIRM|nr:NAD(P)-dependent oxidoreductase [Hydrogenoanaerobacterium saccharovorans]RPF42152.1 nucleoside-diphosphate-sugar epimerase [Hydrogenoanaerobacterium saccharovorans]SEN17847.1 Nucleoside-diphosphate-sugar epimerase [Hydrogenoanaerobacterium saccharovorans]